MSFFGSTSNYTRPGPGVNKNTPPKKPFFRFFEVLARKFTDLFKLNLLFFIPVVIVSAMMIGLDLAGVTSLFISSIPIILLYPFLAGLTLITRNYVREEHAFIFSDFIKAVKENLAKFLAHGILSYISVVIVWVCIDFYLQSVQNGNNGAFLPVIVGFMLLIVILFMQLYVPLMIVTFDLSLKDIYKNALIFSFTAFPRNICLLIYLFVVSMICFFMIASIGTAFIMIIIAACILFSFSSYLINFVIYPIIEQEMIVPYYERVNKEAEKNPEIKNNQKFFYEDGHLYRNYDYEDKKEDKK